VEELINERYRLGERLARFGEGQAYAATDLNDASPCVLRFCAGAPPQATPSAPLLEGRVSHPRLETIYGWEPRPRGWLLVSEAHPSESALLSEQSGLDAPRLARILLEALQGVEALARVGLAHGGLCAERILAGAGGVRLLDPGLARLEPAPFPPPEARDAPQSASRDARGDLYALGALTYERVGGRRPDARHPIPLRELRPEAPVELERALAHLLAADPRERSEVGEARDLLARLAGQSQAQGLPALLEPRWIPEQELLLAAEELVHAADARRAAGRAARRLEVARPLLLIRGGPGLGKSRALAELGQRLPLQGAAVLSGQVPADGDPHAVWRELAELARLRGATPEVVTRFEQALEIGDPRAAHEHLARALGEAGGKRPVLVLLDDAHLLSGPGQAALLHLARAAATGGVGLAVCATVAAGEEGTALARALSVPLAPQSSTADLSELEVEDAETLVASMAPDATPELVQRLARLGGGSPRLLHDLTLEWRLGGGTPRSVIEAVESRLERLGGATRRVLEAIALVGRPLGEEELAGFELHALEAALAEASGLGILAAHPHGYRFRHGVTRRVLLDGLGEEERAELAGRALEALRSHDATRPGELARLALAARSPDAVALALAAAAEDATPDELYSGALELLPAGVERARVQRELAEHQARTGQLGEARRGLELAGEDLREAEESPGSTPDPLERARLDLALTRLAEQEGGAREAMAAAARGRAWLEARERGPAADTLLAELTAAEAKVVSNQGDHAGAARLYARAQAAAGHDPALAARLQVQAAGALVFSLDQTRYPEAEAMIANARQILGTLNDERGLLEATRSEATLAWYRGQPAKSAEAWRRALELSERLGDLPLAGGLLNNLGMTALASGEWSQAEAYLERCLDHAERAGQASVLCRAYTNMGRVRRGLGDDSGAIRNLQAAARTAREAGDPTIESAALSELGATFVGQRRLKSALKALRRSKRLRVGLGDPGRVAESELELGEVWRQTGDVRAALGCTLRALALKAALGDLEGATLAVESLEFCAGRPGGPAAVLVAARQQLRLKGPAPVRAALQRGGLLPEIALRTLAAALAARGGDAEQAQAHAGVAEGHSEALDSSELSPALRGLGRALTHEARAVVAVSQGLGPLARSALDAALQVEGPRRAALHLKRAFFNLSLGEVEAAEADLLAAQADEVELSESLRDRRRVGESLLLAALRRAGREVQDARLSESQATARRLGDVALSAMVAAARAQDALAAGSPQEATIERSAARNAASRLVEGLPAALAQGLARAVAPVPDEEAIPLASAPDQDLLLGMLGRVLNSGLELEPLCQAVLGALVEACDARRGVLALCEGERVVARVGVGLDLLAVRAGDEPSIQAALDHAGLEGLSAHLADATRQPRFARGEKTPRSLLCVPLRGEEGILGALYVDDPRLSGRFGEEERTLAGAFANLVSGPIAKGRARTTREGELTRLAAAYRETARELGSEPLLIGRSPGMRSVERLIQRYGSTSAPVTIHGESGTGKELVARALHRSSDRRDKPFIVLNCAAVAENLIESELFGVEKGSYTGADKSRQGLFELAHTGTLFLDEVGDMSLDMQAKLLRVLETGELRSVGGRIQIKVDVRIVSATHHDMRELVQQGRFREDLLYRLNVLRVELPPLRERREDVLLLAGHFLETRSTDQDGAQKRLSPQAIERLLEHPWPGNVRELRNVIERACVLEPGVVIGPERLLLDPRPPAAPAASGAREGSGRMSQATGPAYHKTFQVQGVPLNRRQRQLLDHLQTSDMTSLTNRDYCALVEVSERTGLRDLTHLVKHGLLVRVGRRKGARYEFGPELRA